MSTSWLLKTWCHSRSCGTQMWRRSAERAHRWVRWSRSFQMWVSRCQVRFRWVLDDVFDHVFGHVFGPFWFQNMPNPSKSNGKVPHYLRGGFSTTAFAYKDFLDKGWIWQAVSQNSAKDQTNSLTSAWQPVGFVVCHCFVQPKEVASMPLSTTSWQMSPSMRMSTSSWRWRWFW